MTVELEAPKGYQKDSTVYTVNLTGDTEVTTFSVEEVPATDPVGIQVYKIDSKTGEQSTRYGGTFENAEFTIKYYDDYYTSLDSVGDDTATRTWVYKTDKKGMIYTDSASYKVAGDELYISNNRGQIPYGTLVIKETKAPYGYEASDETWIVTFTEGSDGKVVRTFYNGNGEKLDATSKIDVGNETTPGTAAISETVADPEISTTALDRTTGLHEGNWQTGDIAIVDTVKVDKIVPGQTYTIKGVLMDKETGEALKDENGDEITEEYTFTAETESTTQTLTFEISDEDTVKAKEIVVFEELYGPDEDVTGEMILRASHKDLNDTDQTVIYPEIQTVALNDSNSHVGNAGTSNNIIDTVTYEGVIPGNTYTVKGTLYDKSTKAQITDEDGVPITSETTFTAQSTKGEVTVNFSNIGYSTLAGKSVVVYEKLYSQDVLLYSHENIKDADQTVTYLDNCAIKIIKYDKNGSTLQGVTYELSDSSGNVVQEDTTDENGEISFEKLPSGTYQLVETKTTDGLSLLKDAITIEIPNTVSVEDAKKMGIDEDTNGVVYVPENNGEKAHYLICKVTCEIRDDATFVLPQTGSNGTWNIGLIALGILACTVTFVYLKSKKRDNI